MQVTLTLKTPIKMMTLSFNKSLMRGEINLNLCFDTALAVGYKSSSQCIRRMTEGWVTSNMFCPRCGNLKIEQFDNNRPVADFFCPTCLQSYRILENQQY